MHGGEIAEEPELLTVPPHRAIETAAKPKSSTGGGSGMAFSAFLTHDWGTDEKGRDNHARVAAVHTALTAAGLRCWFDEEQMQGDINSKMTSGIDNSAVVVAFITSRYTTKVSGLGPNGADDNCTPPRRLASI